MINFFFLTYSGPVPNEIQPLFITQHDTTLLCYHLIQVLFVLGGVVYHSKGSIVAVALIALIASYSILHAPSTLYYPIVAYSTLYTSICGEE
jgi:hypothetical protein